MRPILPALAAAALLSATAAQALTGGSVDPRFIGSWVPPKAGCASPLKVVIEAQRVMFVNGAQRQVFPKLEQCFSCMGRDVTDIILLSTEAMGDSPFMLYLDGTRKPPAVRADFGNDKALGARFPLGAGNLRKCP